ncbi:MAG: hypothetical protein L3J39_10840 [Verrucomicrobiales bacterium]|nr:hypothetical protein [Verrucomicrobiales bacterium]
MPDSDADERRYLLRGFSRKHSSSDDTVQWPTLIIWLTFIPGIFIATKYTGNISMMPVRVLLMASPVALGIFLAYGMHRFTWPYNRKKFGHYLKTPPSPEPSSQFGKLKLFYLCLIFSLILSFWILWKQRGPSFPENPYMAKLTLREPYSQKLIVEKTISDKVPLRILSTLFATGKVGKNHKCSSFGEISFTYQNDEKTLSLLPGHNPQQYEFRYQGRLFTLPKEQYIEALVLAGIEKEDIRLNPHPPQKPRK